MIIRIMLAVPKRGDSIGELTRFLKQEKADLYVFPEGFLDSDTIDQGLDIIKSAGRYVITGYKDLTRRGQQKALVIDAGKIVGSYTKCILTQGEKQKGKEAGEKIHCVDTKFGKIGIPICYEVHFPEVSRIMAREEPALLLNLIGTGMYHELQYAQWTALAKARAIENEITLLGCSHFDGDIPLAYAYLPSGECVCEKKNEYGAFAVVVDLDEGKRKAIGYWHDRVPKLFAPLSE